MYMDIPRLTQMPEPERTRETERALRELAANISRTLEDMERKINEMKRTVEGMKR